MCFVTLANAGTSIRRLERPASNTGRLTVLDERSVQHDGPLVEDKLAHAVIVAGSISEDLKTNKPDKAIGCNVTRELYKEVLLDVGEVRQRPVLKLVGTEAAVGEDEDMPMDRGPFELVEVCGFGPAHVGVLEVGSDHDGTFRDLEVTVNEVNAENLLSVVADK